MKNSKSFEQWDSLTARFSAGANFPFLLLQLPQIILNARNLMAGNKSALLAVPWLVQHHLSLQCFSIFVFLILFGYSECVGKSSVIRILRVCLAPIFENTNSSMVLSENSYCYLNLGRV